MPCLSIAAACSLLARIASNPPCTFGCSVLTRPSIISGKPVSSATSITLSPASFSALAVPPVEINSTPEPVSAVANSLSPVLSDTHIKARVVRRGWLVMGYFRDPECREVQGVLPPPLWGRVGEGGVLQRAVASHPTPRPARLDPR